MIIDGYLADIKFIKQIHAIMGIKLPIGFSDVYS
jgi:hypothetical protein